MSTPPDRRERKRLATRQSISDAATQLFLERGFDRVTVDEIAEAADVARMTVFNHFPRKEDMFFDLDDQARADIRNEIEERDPGIPPIEVIRRMAHRFVVEKKPYLRFFSGNRHFIETIQASETLKARVRAIRDELTQMAGKAMAESVGREAGDPDARLAANLWVAVWAAALARAHEVFQDTNDVEQAEGAFLTIIDRGALGITAAMASTPYAQTD